MAKDPALEPFEVFPGIANGAIDRLFLHFGLVPHTLPTVDAFERGMRRMSRQYGRRYLMLFVGASQRPGAPDEETRARFAALLREHAILPVAAGLAVTSTGLIAATGRSIVTGVLMAARLPIPVRVFGGIAESMTFLSREAKDKGVPIPGLASTELALAALRRSAEQSLQGVVS